MYITLNISLRCVCFELGSKAYISSVLHAIHIQGHFFKSRKIYFVVQHLVLHSQASYERVLREAIRPTTILLIGPRNLLVQRLDIRRQEAMQLELVALAVRKRGSFVEVGIVQELRALAAIRFESTKVN